MDITWLEEKDMRRKDREITETVKKQEIIEACKVCRLGFADEGGVYIVPMNFGYCYEGDQLVLYFHGAKEGKKMDLVRKGPSVGIEMDCGHELVKGKLACQYSYHYASIIGRGKAAEVVEPEEKLKALGLIMKHQTGKEFDEFETNPKLEKAVAIIQVEVEEYSCKQYV